MRLEVMNSCQSYFKASGDVLTSQWMIQTCSLSLMTDQLILLHKPRWLIPALNNKIEHLLCWSAPVRACLLSCHSGVRAQQHMMNAKVISRAVSLLILTQVSDNVWMVCVSESMVSLVLVCDRKHAGVVSTQGHGPGGSGVQSHRQRLPPSHHGLHVSVCGCSISVRLYSSFWPTLLSKQSKQLLSIKMRPHVPAPRPGSRVEKSVVW